MQKFLRRLREILRFCAGAIFWIHAALLLNLPRPPLEQLGTKFGFSATEMALVGFFVLIALLNGYGIDKFLIDVLYIYFFPFILLYYSAAKSFKILVRSGRFACRFSPSEVEEASWKEVLRLWIPSAQFAALESSKNSATKSIGAKPSIEPTKASSKWPEKARRSIARPFVSFTAVWCLLALASTNTWILAVSTIVVSLHAIRFFVTVALTAAWLHKRLAGAERRITTYVDRLVQIVLGAPTNIDPAANVIQAVSMLALLRTAAFLLLRRSEITFLAMLLGIFAYIVVYLRLALLFGFIYFGCSKLQHLPFGFVDSMTTALFIPLTFGNIPRNNLLELIGGVQTVFAVVLGFGAIKAYIQRKIDIFKKTATDLWTALNEEAVRVRLELWRGRTAAAPSESPKAV
jgi:hypothetical protein